MSDPIQITQGLKGRWHGSYGTARCPAHKDRTPSLSISVGTNGKTLVKCHAGCSQERVIGALTALGLWDGGQTNIRSFTPKPNPNGEFALKLWSETVPAEDTLIEKYLASRGITIPIPPSLRFHPSLKYEGGGSWPGMVALVTRGHDAVPIGIHRTFLKRDGSGKAPVPKTKMMLGPCSGGVVRLTDSGETLSVGEGIETCLSVLQAAGGRVWAALSTSGLKALELPPCVREITVLADRDDAGEKAALAAGIRWKAAGLAAMIARPNEGCSDFNEQLLKMGGAA